MLDSCLVGETNPGDCRDKVRPESGMQYNSIRLRSSPGRCASTNSDTLGCCSLYPMGGFHRCVLRALCFADHSFSSERPLNSRLFQRLFCVFASVMFSVAASAQDLESELRQSDYATLAARARQRGNPKQGALIFYKSAAACIKCHGAGDDATPLGPDLAKLGKPTTAEHLVESILSPSAEIRKGYETVNVLMLDGQVKTGLIADDTDERLVLRDAANLEREIIIAKQEIDQIVTGKKSMMPEGLVSSLRDQRDFDHLVRYLIEIAEGGQPRAAQLRPDPKQLEVKDDSVDLDHAGIIAALGEADFQAGERMYLGHCKNCHGTDGNTPTLPTARAFGKQPLKYGADPYKMFMTLTRGAGLMTPMQHLSPKERYQVVYYIREALMKPSNPAYVETDEAYLSGLPKGSSIGEVAESSDRDFGPALGSQLGSAVNNALTLRLADNVTVSYDLHRMKSAGAWQGGFLDLSQTQHYRQRGEQMPQINGKPLSGLGGWQWELGGSFELPAEAKPPRGPVRADWLQYYGHYLYDDRAVLSYGIHGRKVLETTKAERVGESGPDAMFFLHHSMRVDAGDQPLKLSVAKLNRWNSSGGLVRIGSPKILDKSGSAIDHFVFVAGQADEDKTKPMMANRPRHVTEAQSARQLDLGTAGRTIVVRFRTTGNGTLISSAPAKGEWKPNGKALFVRGKRLVYDIGWVGAMVGKSIVSDGEWHTAALVVSEETTRLYVDGNLEAERKGFRRDPETGHVLKIGATATDFGGDFVGDIQSARIFDSTLSPAEIVDLSTENATVDQTALFDWKPDQDPPKPAKAAVDPSHGRVLAAAAVSGDTDGMTWNIDPSGRIVLTIPASDKPRVFDVVRCSAPAMPMARLGDLIGAELAKERTDPITMTGGGPRRWTQTIDVVGELGEPINGYALDTIPVPFENPWNAWMRTSAVDFLADGRAVVTTHGGDVYLVSGLDESLQRVRWHRYAAGLFEPFGVRVVDGVIYVTCRDGLKRLHDFDGNGEADFVEAFWIDDDVSSMFHAYNFDLQTDSEGNFYFAKAGQYTHHHRPGTIMRIPPQGGRAEIVAWGLRTPNGMGKLADDRFTVSDNQGPWMPAGKISLIRQNSFLGNMPINAEQTEWLKQKHGGELPDSFDEPMIWTPQELDNSCGGQVWVDDPRFGPLAGRLIHSSFGKGWLYYLSMQEVDGKTQASIVALPHQWDAGVMRLRVNPNDGQLYGTGLSGWQGPRGGSDGCLQRLRYTGRPMRMIDSTRVTATGIELVFNFALDADSVVDPESWHAEMWDYLWSRNYGSDQYSVLRPGEVGRDRIAVTKVTRMDDRTVHLTIPDLQVCDQLSLKMNFNDGEGSKFVEHVYLTIHAIPQSER